MRLKTYVIDWRSLYADASICMSAPSSCCIFTPISNVTVLWSSFDVLPNKTFKQSWFASSSSWFQSSNYWNCIMLSIS